MAIRRALASLAALVTVGVVFSFALVGRAMSLGPADPESLLTALGGLSALGGLAALGALAALALAVGAGVARMIARRRVRSLVARVDAAKSARTTNVGASSRLNVRR
ncbi:MAG: hypothetical protein RMA76_44985 [Deltaproteobacteria bacterium]